MSQSPNSSSQNACVICQASISDVLMQEQQKLQHQSNLPLTTQLQYRPNQLELITLPCSHVFHRQCLVKWIHFDNTTCPLCRKPINLPGLETITWKLNNVAVRTRCSPESIRLGLKADGWFNVQIQIIPPAGKNIKRVRYVFHPAFSLNKLDIKQPPYDLVMKLVSNAVDVIIEVTLESGKVFTFIHQLTKELCTRVYYEDMYNGSDFSEEISATKYFEGILDNYKREADYYDKEMPPPPRFQNRDNDQKGIFQRLFGGLFQG
uniref:Ring finger domain-containing protein n=1 Tax=Trepomonas sp. PC1 TaxID=1076344 RepID=A0A146K7C8_9EUKA|eukprot:JAP91409.1 Ring finger domain-containing protein [Trepomonas sp. PC1]